MPVIHSIQQPEAIFGGSVGQHAGMVELLRDDAMMMRSVQASPTPRACAATMAAILGTIGGTGLARFLGRWFRGSAWFWLYLLRRW